MNSATGVHLLRQAGSVVAARLPRTWDTSRLLLQALYTPTALVSRDQRRWYASAAHSATVHQDAPSPAEEACLALYFHGTEPQQDFNAGRVTQVPGGFTMLCAHISPTRTRHAYAPSLPPRRLRGRARPANPCRAQQTCPHTACLIWANVTLNLPCRQGPRLSCWLTAAARGPGHAGTTRSGAARSAGGVQDTG